MFKRVSSILPLTASLLVNTHSCLVHLPGCLKTGTTRAVRTRATILPRESDFKGSNREERSRFETSESFVSCEILFDQFRPRLVASPRFPDLLLRPRALTPRGKGREGCEEGGGEKEKSGPRTGAASGLRRLLSPPSLPFLLLLLLRQTIL